MLTMRLPLCLLLIWTTTADAKITVKSRSDGIEILCDDVNLQTLSYDDRSSGEYNCSEEKIFVRFRTCDNCIEMDIVSIVGFTAGDLVATVLIGVAVFLVASHAKTLPTTSESKRNSRQHPPPQDNRSRNPNATYQELVKNPDEYDKLKLKR